MTIGRVFEITSTVATVVVLIAVLWARYIPAKSPNDGRNISGRTVSVADRPMVGSKAAPMVMVILSDFECPFCGQFARLTWPLIEDEYVSKGLLTVVFKHLPLSIHDSAVPAAIAAACAGRQSAFWGMHDRIFADQSRLDETALETYARTLDLDLDAWQRCRQTGDNGSVGADEAEARDLGIGGTPTFLLGSRLGDSSVKVTEVLSGALPIERFRESLDRLIAD